MYSMFLFMFMEENSQREPKHTQQANIERKENLFGNPRCVILAWGKLDRKDSYCSLRCSNFILMIFIKLET